MSDGLFKRVGMSFQPASAEALEQVMAVKEGHIGVGEIAGARNPKQSALYFALCRAVSEAMDTPEEPVTQQKVDLTLRATLLGVTYSKDMFGRVYEQVPSLKAHKMPQAEFNAFFQRATKSMAAMVSCAPKELAQRVYDMIDGDLKNLMKDGYLR